MVVSVSGAVAEVGSLEKGTRWCRCSPRSHTFEIARFSDVAALAGCPTVTTAIESPDAASVTRQDRCGKLR